MSYSFVSLPRSSVEADFEADAASSGAAALFTASFSFVTARTTAAVLKRSLLLDNRLVVELFLSFLSFLLTLKLLVKLPRLNDAEEKEEQRRRDDDDDDKVEEVEVDEEEKTLHRDDEEEEEEKDVGACFFATVRTDDANVAALIFILCMWMCFLWCVSLRARVRVRVLTLCGGERFLAEKKKSPKKKKEKILRGDPGAKKRRERRRPKARARKKKKKAL